MHKVLLDGVEMRSLGLNEVRRAIAIIPQDPVLFTGTSFSFRFFESNLIVLCLL